MSSNSMQQALGKAALVAAFLVLVPFGTHAADPCVGGSLGMGGPGFSIGVSGTNCPGMGGFGGGGLFGGTGAFGLPTGSIYGIIGNLVYWLLAILGFIGIIAFVVAGLMYLLAFGDDKQAEKAKNALKFSIYGVIVALLGLIIMQAIYYWLSGSVTF